MTNLREILMKPLSTSDFKEALVLLVCCAVIVVSTMSMLSR